MQYFTRFFILTSFLACLSFLCLNLTACSNIPPRLYRIDIRQGNDISDAMIARLRIGMSKEQVIEILGSPTLSHALNVNRFDYYYYFKSGKGGAIVEKHFAVFFKGGRVTRWSHLAE